MAAYVIKEWQADVRPVDDKNNYVRIVARKGGLISWFLALVGVDPTVTLSVSSRNFVHEQGSLFGWIRRVTPLSKISSITYGYRKPLPEAILIFLFLGSGLMSVLSVVRRRGLGVGTVLLAVVIALVAAGVYYALNKTAFIEAVDNAGKGSGLRFKRSVIENQKIDETQAERVSGIVQALMDKKA